MNLATIYSHGIVHPATYGDDQRGNFPIDGLCKTYPVANMQEAVHDMHTGKVNALF